MNNFTIYLRTNTINGKHYVGQTSDFKRREWEWKYLKNTYANKYLDSDREEYGLDNWSVEILNKCDTREEAWQLEQYYIDKFDCIFPNGYNLSKGGSGNSSTPSEETRKKISINSSKYWLGKQFSEEHRKKLSEVKKGIIPKCANPQKQVYQYTLDGKLVKVWESTAECGRNGYNQGNVAACCRGERKSYKGFIWSYVPLLKNEG